MYTVLIIEDDPMVAAIERSYIEHNDLLRIGAILSNGREALNYLRSHHADLILLDYYMPQMNGKQFLQELRATGNPVDIIMVTAANDSASVGSVFIYGVIDYLVKPFDRARFQHAINRFLMRKDILNSGQPLSQDHIDRLNVSLGPPMTAPAYMEKGVQQATVDMVMNWLKDHPYVTYSLDELSDSIGLSRVTMRRYMNHLVKQGIVDGSIRYSTGGRPSPVFCYNPPKS